MINDKIQAYFVNEKYPLIKDGDEVAVIHSWHKLDHAMLILTSDTYNVVPVLNKSSQVVGLISMSRIVKAVVSGADFSFGDLDQYTVQEVMDQDFDKLVLGEFDLEDVLQQLVSTSFLCVVDDQGIFKGIITRSTILQGINRLVHAIDQDFDLRDK